MPMLIWRQMREFVRRGLLTWRRILLQAALILACIALEAAGVSLVVPVLKATESGQSLQEYANGSAYLSYVATAFATVGLPMTLATVLGGIFAIICLRQTATYVQIMTMSHTKTQLEKKLMERLFHDCISTGAAQIQELGTGRFTYIVNNLANGAATVIRTYGAFFYSAVLCIAYLAIAVPTAPIPTLAGVFIAMTLFAAMGRLARRVRAISTRGIQLRQSYQNYLTERYRNWRQIKLSNFLAAEAKNLETWTRRIYGLDIETTRLSSLNDLIVIPLMSLMTLATLYLSIEVFRISISEVAVLVLVMIRLEPVVRSFSQQRQALERFTPQLEQCLRDLDAFAAGSEPDPGRLPFPVCRSAIEFENVSFSYPGGETPVLDSISLRIPAGKMTALIGPSGAGKSTLLDLLPRLRLPTAGRILVDGVDINEIALPALRGAIAYVGQRAALFDMSIMDNIRYGQTQLDDAEIVAAAKLAQAHDFIAAMPEGYRTKIGEGGANLSGGQQQRIAIARAFARRAPILILDEPTSALDYESEARIKVAIDAIRTRNEVTIIVIAHRLSTVASADHMVVLAEGRVVQSGKPADLDMTGGWYADMLTLQSGS
jgi:ABC-type multidrug transport system fused ATPase/permease subunit